MRHLFASRGTAAAFVGTLALLAAGGAYALSSTGTTTINACIHHKGGALYIAKPCATGDKAISWNKVGPRGPAGPGATSINFSTAGSASPTLKTFGKAGPLTLEGTCTTTGSGAGATTQFVIGYKGPAVHVDGFIIEPDGTAAPYSQTAPATSGLSLATDGPTAGQDVVSAQLFVAPTGSPPFEAMLNAVADGGTPANGNPADNCHFSAVITPAP